MSNRYIDKMDNSSRRERERQRKAQEIIEAAVTVFSKNGFENSSMDEIAARANYTKRTVYKHFLNKDDLFFAVVWRAVQIQFEYLRQAFAKGENGFKKVEYSVFAYYDFVRDHLELFKLINYVGIIMQRSDKQCPYKVKLHQETEAIFGEIITAIRQGKEDGSIRKNLDETIAAHTMVFLLNGFFSNLINTGEFYAGRFNMDRDAFVDFALHLISNSIKG